MLNLDRIPDARWVGLFVSDGYRSASFDVQPKDFMFADWSMLVSRHKVPAGKAKKLVAVTKMLVERANEAFQKESDFIGRELLSRKLEEIELERKRLEDDSALAESLRMINRNL